MEMSKDYKISKRLNDFLDRALEEAEEQKKYWTDERIEKHSENFQKIVAEEIAELEKILIIFQMKKRNIWNGSKRKIKLTKGISGNVSAFYSGDFTSGSSHMLPPDLLERKIKKT